LKRRVEKVLKEVQDEMKKDAEAEQKAKAGKQQQDKKDGNEDKERKAGTPPPGFPGESSNLPLS